MLKDKEAGARHLSSNKYVHHLDEGPAEKLESLLAEYLAVEADDAPAKLENWIVAAAKVNSKVGQIFHHSETVVFLKALREFRPHFNMDEFFSVKFCGDTIHKVNGAVNAIKSEC